MIPNYHTVLLVSSKNHFMLFFNTISYRNQAKSTIIQLSNTANASFSINIKEICKEHNIDYTILTQDNFLLVISSYTSSTAGTDFTSYGNGGYLPWGKDSFSSISKTYNPSTGIFTCTIPTNYYTAVAGPYNVAKPGEDIKYFYHYTKIMYQAQVIPYLVVY